DEEFEAVKQVEDRIGEFVDAMGGAYVGRVTVAGHRYFYCYGSASPDEIERFVTGIEESTGYRLQVRTQDDPEKAGYWKDLYPTADDWQMIQDTKVVEALKKHGDVCEIARRIDHWAYFAAKSDSKAFATWLASEGFSIHEIKRTKLLTGDWKVQFFRVDSPELYTINGITYQLRHKIAEFNGEYDGWETSVKKGAH
ncbi:MAG: DUF695 domain-containing protein, partial [Gammaproteobacteria bacterium]|nr:DUF695 domain-containing protein [Gammaproteobacteria bacterium]